MSCDLTLGRLEPCKNNVGGIDKIYFVNYGDMGTVTTGSDDDITDMTGTFSIYEYEVKSDATNLEETITSDRNTGTTFFSQVINITLKNKSKEMNKQLKLMAYGRPHVIIWDRNGKAWLAGLNRGCEVTGGTVVTGGAMGDLYGYTITLTGQEELPANIIDGATAADPLAGMSSATVTVVQGS